jgi:hypothetical protein
VTDEERELLMDLTEALQRDSQWMCAGFEPCGHVSCAERRALLARAGASAWPGRRGPISGSSDPNPSG